MEHRVALIGYDDTEYSAATAVPLTSVKQPVQELASEAMLVLIGEAEETDHEHRHVLLRPELVIRDSTPRL